MMTEVRFRGIETSASLRDHAVRLLHLHLGRFASELGMVRVRIGDVNGPRGGVDKHCQISLRGPRIGELTVEQLSEDFYLTVTLAVERVSHLLRRELERVRTGRFRGVPPLGLAGGRAEQYVQGSGR